MPGAARDRLLAEAAGNLLALLELGGGLSDEQLRGLVPLPEAMPLTPRLEDVFRQRIGRLPPTAQTALLIAAADNTGDAGAVLRSAELSTDESRRTRRIAASAQAAWDAGQADRARGAIARALRRAAGELWTQLLHLSGVIEARTGSLPEASTRLTGGAADSSDPSLKLEMLIEAVEAATMTGDLARAAEIADSAASITPVSARDHLIGTLLRGFGKAFAGQHKRAQSLLTDAMRQADTLGDPRALVWASNAASVAGDPADSLRYANRAVEAARRQGLLSVLPLTLEQQAIELLACNDFDRAYAAAEEGYRLCLDIAHGHGWHLVNMAAAEAVWGWEEDARRHAGEALAVGQRSGSTFLASNAEMTLGMLELTMGQPDLAADRLLALTDPDRPGFNPDSGAARAFQRGRGSGPSGRPAAAAERLAIARGWVEGAPTQARRALLARSRPAPSCCTASGCYENGTGPAHALSCAPLLNCSSG